MTALDGKAPAAGQAAPDATAPGQTPGSADGEAAPGQAPSGAEAASRSATAAGRVTASRAVAWRHPRWRLPLRPLMLRTRFTLAVAGVVALSALAVTVVAFFVVRADLQGQLRRELDARAASVQHMAYRHHEHIPDGWVPRHSNQFGTSSPYTQIVTSDGTVWSPPGYKGLLDADKEAINVAAGRKGSYYYDTRLDGVRAMVLTKQIAPGLAMQAAEPVGPVDREVARVGATLAGLSGIFVMIAAVVGWFVARAGLAPVSRLAAVAEQVTATGDPDRQVEVDRPDELGRLAASFNTMLGALRRSLAAQRQLISDASHELRTPLTSLRINVEMLADDSGLSAEDRREVLDRVTDQVAELGQLVANVTELARGESPVTAHDDVRFDEVIATALESARRDWPQTTFTERLAPCVVYGSAERLRSAARYLLDNAAKFGPPAGPVEVSLRAGELTVRDYGPGLAEADLPHVFDRFYRSPSARGVPGSGLGLAIVRQVAQSHGGTVRAELPAGGGTLLRLRLPAR